MTEPFGHEKLIVYQKGMRFAVLRGALLERMPRQVAACDHLERGAESILLNIAHASSTGSANERMVYLGHANGSALGRELLRRIAAMLTALSKVAAHV
jgi:hypothetical protein